MAAGRRSRPGVRGWAIAALAGVAVLLATALAIATNIGTALIPSGWMWARNGIVVWTVVGLLTAAGMALAVIQQHIAGHAEGDVDGGSGAQILVGPVVSGMTGGIVIDTNAGQVLTGPVTLTSAVLPELGAPLSGPLSNLPLRDPDFTGREDMLAIVSRELAEAGVVAVHGLGGVGKSQLAIEFARRGSAAGIFDVAWWIRAESTATIVEDLATLASALKIPGGQDQARTVAAVREVLQHRDRWLLIFDNVPEARAVRTWLPTGGGQVLITSRDRSWVGLARRVELGSFTRSESLGYLRQRTGRDERLRRLWPRFWEICRWLWRRRLHISNCMAGCRPDNTYSCIATQRGQVFCSRRAWRVIRIPSQQLG